MSSKELKAYIKLRKELRRHDVLYYKKSQPEISDFEYDCLKKELQYLEEKFPHLKTVDEVGDDRNKGFSKKAHRSPMLSLENTYAWEGIQHWVQRIQKLLHQEDLYFVLEPKVDGIAISLTYEKGRLLYALTRGNGREGDDVTENILNIPSIPKAFQGSKIPELVEIRGEVYMSKIDFQRLNQRREEEGLTPYSTARNLASGSLKLLSAEELEQRELSAIFYDFGEISDSGLVQNQIELLKIFQEWSLPCFSKVVLSTVVDLQKNIIRFEQWRDQWPYLTDGVVIKLNRLSQRHSLGMTARAPLGAIAFKFTPERQETTIRDIILQVGRTGVLTPVAVLDPVFLGGTKVQRATLHNESEIIRKDIAIGDRVLLERAGDVIPAVDRVVVPAENKVPYRFPQKCPFCQTPLTRFSKEIAWRCLSLTCPPQIRRKILHFGSKWAMNIHHLGPVVVNQLVEKSLLQNYADLYRLRKQDLLLIEHFGDKAAENLLLSIEASKSRSLWRLLHGLGIQHVGAELAKKLADALFSLKAIAEANLEQLLAIEGCGQAIAESIKLFFRDQSNWQIIQQLKAAGVVVEASIEDLTAREVSISKTFSFSISGKLSASREEAVHQLEVLGGIFHKNLSAQTNYFLTGEKPSPEKLKKAKTLNIPIVSEGELKNIFLSK